jgi:hypothetical protein
VIRSKHLLLYIEFFVKEIPMNAVASHQQYYEC